MYSRFYADHTYTSGTFEIDNAAWSLPVCFAEWAIFASWMWYPEIKLREIYCVYS